MRSPHDAGGPAAKTHAEPLLAMLQCMLYQVPTEPSRNEKAVSFMVGGAQSTIPTLILSLKSYS